jgi:hypothetical protein
MKFKTTKQEAQLKPGLYPAKFQMIDEKTGNYGPYLIWTFQLDKNGTHVSYLTSRSFLSNSKARKLVEALKGRPMKDGEEVDLDELFGAPCQLLIEIAELDDGGTVNRVERVLPPASSEDADEEIPF